MKVNKEFLATFKKDLEAAGKLFNRQPHQVTLSQLYLVQTSNLTLVRALGFSALKEWAYPSPNPTEKTREQVEAIKRILKAA